MSFTSQFKSITDIAAEKTERKEPTGSTAASSIPFFEPEGKKEEKKTETPGQPAPALTAAGLPKLTKERAEMSGAANAYIWGGTIEVFWGTIETIVNNFSMSKEEKKKLLASRKKTKESWTNEDKQINERFNDLFKTHQDRKKVIKLSEEENKALRYAYTLYAEVTGKETDPAAIKWAAIIRILAGKGLELYG